MATDFTLNGPPATEDPKGPLMQCRWSKCLMILRRDECRIRDEDAALICPYCLREMRRYRSEWESAKK